MDIEYAYAALTAHAINSLPDEDKCCAHKCAPCQALVFLQDNGKLTEVVRPYLLIAGFTMDWWDNDNDRIRWSWISYRLCDPKTCEDKEYEKD